MTARRYWSRFVGAWQLPIDWLEIPVGGVALDVGSGPGNITAALARAAGPEGLALGIDISEPMLSRAVSAEAKPNVGFLRADAQQLPFRDETFDAATSLAVLQLIRHPVVMMKEAARVLRPGGRLVISDIVLDAHLPAAVAADVYAYVGCISGASLRAEYFEGLSRAGLGSIEILKDVDYLAGLRDAAPEQAEALLARTGTAWKDVEGRVRSLTYRARKA